MKKRIGILFGVLLAVLPAWGQGIEFFEGSWQEALAEAKANNKLIFVDAYASWCGPCKRMSATVFTQKEVGDFFNERFLNFKIDMEKGEGPAFGRKYPVRAYPTLLFIDYDGTLVHRQVGAQRVESLLALGEKALGMIDRSAPFAEKYKKGDRSPELVYNYIAALNQAGKSSLRIANDFLRNDPDWNDEMVQRIVFESLQQLDSRIYKYFTQNREAIEKLYPREEIDRKVLRAGDQTVKTAIEFQSTDLLAEAQQKVSDQCTESKAAGFSARSNMAYGKAVEDYKLFYTGLKSYNKEVAETEPKAQWIKVLKYNFTLLGTDKKIDKELEELSARITEESPTYEDFTVYAQILNHNGKTGEALSALDRAEELAKEQQPRAQVTIMRLREKINR